MLRRLAALLACLALFSALPALADPADIDAAARGVVRVIIVEKDGDQLVPVSHGTGFAVTPERVVTNSHVVEQVQQDPKLFIGIVPSDGGEAVFGRLVTVSPRNDLALVATTKPMHLPPLTISGNPNTESGAVVAVGYPQNVDVAQGLNMADLFRPQPPVESSGSLAGRRPSRQFDTLLHTAPIARGSSGGPLLDSCGRVLGVNSFGAETSSAEAGFYFAISTRELLPFLRANAITPQINDMPCRSLAELNTEERQRAEEQKVAAEEKARSQEETLSRQREEERRKIDFQILDERDNGLALALVLLLVALGATGFAWLSYEDGEDKRMKVGGAVAIVALLGAGFAWFSRPTFAEGDERLQDLLRQQMTSDQTGAIPTPQPAGALVCTLDPDRSRVVGAANSTVPLAWKDDGCVNGRTQYGLAGGSWTRVSVPESESNVSVSTFDPSTGDYRMDRYLLDSDQMAKVRQARAGYQAPACGGGQEAAQKLGSDQDTVLSLLPQEPNERLVYRCAAGKAP
ncbi:MAG: trypsin-like peptidase domain-containing protein [Porphyrobacter sp.]|nr:trypsin-like peptidase domain-containing protein [Porphyrobacter sp.]